MSDLSKRLSNKLLRRMQDAEIDCGPRVAGEIAEAHVDAGTRYLDGERLQDWRPPVLTEMPLQNQI